MFTESDASGGIQHHLSAGHELFSGIQGSAQGVTTCHPLQPSLQSVVTGYALQIPHHGQNTIRANAPAQGRGISQSSQQVHQQWFLTKTTDQTADDNVKPFIAK